LDAFTGLVGEHILWDLKAYIKRRHASGQPYNLALHNYKSILDRLHRRKIKVNQDFFAFLGLVLVWEGIDENKALNEDGDGRPFFETFDDEPTDSEGESLESNTEIED
jgi:hypothetical protein